MTTEYGPPAREVFETQRRTRKKRAPDQQHTKNSSATDPVTDVDNESESYFGKLRQTRQSFRNNQSTDSGR